MHMLLPSICALAVLSLVACGGGRDADDDGVAGPCFVEYTSTVFTLVSAVNEVSAAPIPQVTLANITVGGVPLSLVTLPTQASNVRVSGATVQCTLPCGFSIQDGAYSMSVSAPGCATKTVVFTAGYTSHVGSCPATVGGGSRISLALAPA
jgi:hypothetical protein